MAKNIDWTSQQQAVLDAPNHDLLVSAAAGSGKTAVLIERVLLAALGGNGHDPVHLERMLVITFTRAAARELKHRLNSQLEQRRAELAAAPDDPAAVRELANIRRQLEALPRAQISTIDSFFLDIVRRYGHTRNLAVGQLLSEDEAKLARHDLATALLEEHFGRHESEFSVLALAWGGIDGLGPEDLSAVQFESGLRRHLLGLHTFLQSLVDPTGWTERMLGQGWLDEQVCDTGHPLLAEFNAELVDWAASELRSDEALAGELLQEYPGAVYLELIARRSRVLRQLQPDAGWESLRVQLGRLFEKQDDLLHKPTLSSDYKRDIDNPDLKNLVELRAKEFRSDCERWRGVFADDWAVVARRQNAVQRCLTTLVGLEQEFAGRFSSYKQEHRRCDFGDLARYALQLLAAADNSGQPLLTDGQPQPNTCAAELRSRYELVVIDEYQDTNELQDAVIDLATREVPGSADTTTRPRMVVGDIKQSIYAFRQADPQVFAARRHQLERGGLSGEALKLSVNFRSRPAIIDGINSLFDGLMTDQFGGDDYPENRLSPGLDYTKLFTARGATPQPDYPVELQLVDSSGLDPDNDPQPDDPDGDNGEVSTRQQLIYMRVVEVIQAIQAGGQLVWDNEEKTVRPVRWRDIVVLLRAASGRVETLRSILINADVPCYIPSRSGFYQRPEVADALALLTVLDNPRNDVALATVLSGPALRLDQLQLLSIARCLPTAPSLFDRLLHYHDHGDDESLLDRVAEFMRLYHRWRELAVHGGLGELAWRVFTESGLLAATAAQPGSRQRMNNLIQLHDLARSAEHDDRRGLPRFLRFLELSRQAKGDAGEAPVLMEGEDVVRVLTVHQAKGLEFPVVVVPDLQARFNRMDVHSDVLWHRTAGLGGRFYDLVASPPQKTNTLGRLHTARAKLRDLTAEQLRLLYVSLTRARERLVLVTAIDDRHLNRLWSPKPPDTADCWFDWVAAHNATELGRLYEPGAPAELTTATGWLLKRSVGPPDSADTGQAVAASDSGKPGGEEFSTAIRRLQFEYPWPGATRLPLKATATGLGKRRVIEDDSEAAALTPPVTEPVSSPQTITGFTPAAELAAATGSAVHLLLERLDFSTKNDPAAVASLIAALEADGQIEPDVVSGIDPGAISTTAGLIAALATERQAEIHKELPLGVFAPAEWLEQASVSVSPNSLPAETNSDHVYVQGIADLLLVGADTCLVIDYKTDRNVDANELKTRYRGQLEWYCRMVATLLPNHQVEWAILHVGGSGLVGPVTFDSRRNC